MNIDPNHYKPLFSLIFIIAFPAIIWGADIPVNVHYSSPEEVTAKGIEYLIADDFDSAVKLFHIPPSYSVDEVNDDIEGITTSLKIFRSDFGSISQVRFNQSPIQYYNLAIGGGNIDYWHKYPTSVKTDFEVAFDKLGKGYISVEACKISSSWEIRSISYGLPVASPDSKSIITNIAKKLMMLMEEQTKKNERKMEPTKSVKPTDSSI